MDSNKLPSYEECLKECQCVIYYDYMFVVESRRGFSVVIFENDYALIEEPILNQQEYESICNYWYDITENAEEEQKSRKEKDNIEYLEYPSFWD